MSVKVGDEQNEKGEKIVEWKVCGDVDHIEGVPRDFYITEKEERFYQTKGFVKPKRCHPCRVRKRRNYK